MAEFARLDVADAVEALARPLTDAASLDPILDLVGDARYVLIGEASHGTSDFYTWRARLSQRLIAEKGFSFVSVEGDWPDAYRVNRYVKGYLDSGAEARDVLASFDRWPTWMWANWEVTAFVRWLRAHNDRLPPEQRVGFYGLDVYSLWESMRAIMDYLEETDPEAAQTAREAYLCFEPYGQDVQRYAWATAMVPTTCEDEVVQLLAELRRGIPEYPGDAEAKFNAEQNAWVMVNAERYYRAMVRSNADSWNIRDQHMADVLDRLMQYHGPRAKGIVWEHNTHVGDARATDMAGAGMVNVGQLARERHSNDGVVLVGFGTYRGSVIAGNSWGAPMEVMPVPEARRDSWEALLHAASAEDKFLILPLALENGAFLMPRGHRAIGVVYDPKQERFGNYVPTVLPNRYDAFLFIDESEALHPLHLAPYDTEEPPETYPWGV